MKEKESIIDHQSVLFTETKKTPKYMTQCKEPVIVTKLIQKFFSHIQQDDQRVDMENEKRYYGKSKNHRLFQR